MAFDGFHLRWLGAVLSAAICTTAMAQSLPHEFEGIGAAAPKPSGAGPLAPRQWMKLAPSAQGMEPMWVPHKVDAALLNAISAAKWQQALEQLRQSGANANIEDEAGTSLLALAVRAGQDELVRELLLRGANANAVGADGYTPLGAAAQAGHVSLIRALLKAGARIDAPGSTGLTPLQLACAGGQLAAIDALL